MSSSPSSLAPPAPAAHWVLALVWSIPAAVVVFVALVQTWGR